MLDRFAIICSFLLAFFTGYPAWLKTTAVYRSKIQFERIDATRNLKLTSFNCEVHIHLSNKFKNVIDSEALAQEIQLSQINTLRKAAQALSAETEPAVNLDLIYQVQFMTDDQSPVNPDDLISSASPANDSNYHVYVVSSDGGHSQLSKSAAWNVDIGVGRNILLRPTVSFTQDQLGRVLNSILATIFSQELHEIFIGLPYAADKDRFNEQSMRMFKYSPEFHLSFNLMNGASDDFIVNWQIERAIEEWIRPVLSRLSVVTNFYCYNQKQQYSPLAINVGYSMQAKAFQVSPDSLPHLFNVGEWDLDSPLSNSTEIKLAIFVPPKSQSPLIVLNENGDPATVNAVLLPRWGGIYILNLPRDEEDLSTTIPRKVMLDSSQLKLISSVFLQQIRLLLGIEPVWPNNRLSQAAQKTYDISVRQHRNPSGISDWEMDKLLRRRIAEISVGASETLRALGRLLKSMPNMPVSDSIKNQIEDALLSLEKACLQQNLIEMFAMCKKASILADRSFFDPTMTAMLYFPDEHLYAVYAPLFFPIAVPFILSIFREFAIKRNKVI